jgi:hypothetical protein
MAEEQTLQNKLLYWFNKAEGTNYNTLQEAIYDGRDKEVLAFIILYLDDIVKGAL